MDGAVSVFPQRLSFLFTVISGVLGELARGAGGSKPMVDDESDAGGDVENVLMGKVIINVGKKRTRIFVTARAPLSRLPAILEFAFTGFVLPEVVGVMKDRGAYVFEPRKVRKAGS